MTTDIAPITSEQTTLALGDLHPAADNPRKNMGDLAELVASIKTVGLLEPIVVTQNGEGFTIVAGARRHAAAKKAGLDTVPVVVLSDLSEEQRQEAMLIENLQRSDLTPIEEATAFGRLIDLGLSQKDLAAKIGRSASHISKRLQLLELPDAAQDAVEAGTLPIADALELKALAGKPQPIIDETIRLVTGQDEDYDDRWNPEQALVEATRNYELATKIEEATKLAKADPAEWRQPRKDRYNDHLIPPEGARILGKGWGELGITPAKHRKESCHAVTVTSNYSSAHLTYICMDPGKHPEAKGRTEVGGSGNARGGTLTEGEKAKRKAKREHNAALNEATKVRHEFIRRFFAKKMTAAIKDDAIALLLSEYFTREVGVPYHSRGTFAASVLGVKPKEDRYGSVRPLEAIESHVKANSHEVLRAALAIGVGTVEDSITGRYPSWQNAKPYFEFLERHGYTPSKAERLSIAGKAPK